MPPFTSGRAPFEATFANSVLTEPGQSACKIKPEEMANVKTLSQFCDYIESKVNA